MSQTISNTEVNASRLFELYSPIANDLKQVDGALQEELRNRHPAIDKLARHSFRLGGKRLRPALLLLAGKAVGDLSRDHIVLGAVVEMIHTATLVHDDVLDEASIRRHLDTVNARWGNETSVLLGDYLFTHAFYLASTLESTYACRMIGRATNTVCEGELRQIHSSGNFELGEEEYLAIVEAKTAALCACCCQLGAHYAGADEDLAKRLSEHGRLLGIAFQIMDDVLDIVGEQQQMGKSLGTDVEKQKLTLPIIHALGHASGDDYRGILRGLQHPAEDGRTALKTLIDRYEGLQYATGVAQDFAQRAASQLESLDTPAAQCLKRITQYVVTRDR